jgi:glucose/arabinose dehydrogenase
MKKILLILAVTVLSAAGGWSQAPDTVGFGPAPTLPLPRTSLIPTVNVIAAKGWPASVTPLATEGLAVSAFARGLDHPRWLYVLPSGDVLVAETSTPPRGEEPKGIRGFFFKRMYDKGGSAVPSANRITLLRDRDGDGEAETRFAFVSGLNSPFGIALVDDTLYVANTDALLAFPYKGDERPITAAPQKIVDLPAGPRNYHWTRNVVASPDGSKLYVSVGSNSNIAEHGIDAEEGRAAIWEIDRKTGAHRIFASGLRNPVGMAWEPETGALWTAVNERDELGNDLVPDYITSVRDDGFYGWPYSYYGAHVDPRVKPKRPELVEAALAPDYAVGAHTASLGLAYSDGKSFPSRFGAGMFIGQHGSWNRNPRSGYKVIFVTFVDGKPSGMPIDVLTGFVSENGDGMGRPVGVAIDKAGGLLVADDVGNTVWRVTSTRPRAVTTTAAAR